MSAPASIGDGIIGAVGLILVALMNPMIWIGVFIIAVAVRYAAGLPVP